MKRKSIHILNREKFKIEAIEYIKDNSNKKKDKILKKIANNINAEVHKNNSRKNSQENNKFFTFFRQIAFLKISELYRSPYIKLPSIEKNLKNQKPNEILRYDFYKISNLLLNIKNRFLIHYKEYNIYYDSKEYITRYYPYSEYLINLRYFLMFIYNRDIYTSYRNKISYYHDNNSILFKYQLLQITYNYNENNNKFITSLSWKNIRNCIPNYFNNDIPIKIALQKYITNIKYRKLKTNEDIKKIECEKKIIIVSKSNEGNINNDKINRTKTDNTVNRVRQQTIKDIFDNDDYHYQDSDEGFILKDIFFDSKDDSFKDNDKEYENLQMYFHKNQNKLSKEREAKDIINIINEIEKSIYIKKNKSTENANNNNNKSYTCRNEKKKNLKLNIDKTLTSIKKNKNNSTNNNTNIKKKNFSPFIEKSKNNNIKSLKSILNVKKQPINLETFYNINNYEKPIFKDKKNFLNGMKRNDKNKIYKRKLFDKINNTYKIIKLFTDRNEENSKKLNKKDIIFPRINYSLYIKNICTLRNTSKSKESITRNKIFKTTNI